MELGSCWGLSEILCGSRNYAGRSYNQMMGAMKLMRVFATILLLAFCSACTTYQKYGNPSLPPEQSAVVTGPPLVLIIAINGVKNEDFPMCNGPFCTAGFQITLPPGPHVIEARYADDRMASGIVPVWVNLFAGRQYEFKSEFQKDSGWSSPLKWMPSIVEVTAIQGAR